MDSQTSRKIIVASGMAVVVGVSVVAFALSSHHTTSAPQVSAAADSLAPTPAPPAGAAQTPAAPAAVAPIPDAPAVAQPKAARTRHLAKAPTSADTTARVVTPSEPKPAVETPAPSVDGVKSADVVTPPPAPPAPSSTTPDAQGGSASIEPPAAPDAGSPPSPPK
jgi:translation initiation factor IF-2